MSVGAATAGVLVPIRKDIPDDSPRPVEDRKKVGRPRRPLPLPLETGPAAIDLLEGDREIQAFGYMLAYYLRNGRTPTVDRFRRIMGCGKTPAMLCLRAWEAWFKRNSAYFRYVG